MRQIRVGPTLLLLEGFGKHGLVTKCSHQRCVQLQPVRHVAKDRRIHGDTIVPHVRNPMEFHDRGVFTKRLTMVEFTGHRTRAITTPDGSNNSGFTTVGPTDNLTIKCGDRRNDDGRAPGNFYLRKPFPSCNFYLLNTHPKQCASRVPATHPEK